MFNFIFEGNEEQCDLYVNFCNILCDCHIVVISNSSTRFNLRIIDDDIDFNNSIFLCGMVLSAFYECFGNAGYGKNLGPDAIRAKLKPS